MRLLTGLATIFALAGTPVAAQVPPMTENDPHIWLEDKDGAKALAWVEAENAPTLKRLQGDPRYQTFYQEALAIAAAKDRIPMPSQTGGRILNFWRDAEHPLGLLRVTSESDYATPNPTWRTLIDVDALSRAEGKQWVFKGLNCLQPEERLCLVSLSEGGEDAVSYREFDLETGQFVTGGFALPKSKQGAAWIDRDTLLVSRDWGTGTLTASSYPFVVRMLKRGQPLTAATEVFRGQASDQLGTYASSLTDAQGNRLVTIERRTAFFGGDKLVWTPAGTRKLDMPPRATIAGLVDGRVVFQTSDDWGAIKAGSVAWAPLAEVKAGQITPRLLWAPTPRQAAQGVATTRSRVIVTYIDNVRGRASVFAPAGEGWSQTAVPCRRMSASGS
jgi:prolyl oligopeptidase